MKAQAEDKTVDTARLDDRSRIPIPKLVKDELNLRGATPEEPGSLVAFMKNKAGQIYLKKLP